MPASTGSQCPSGSVPYVVRAGDTLGNIAFFYNTSVSDIVKANPGINPNRLRVGQQLCVPMQKQIYPACPTTNYYVVNEGDTMASIASRRLEAYRNGSIFNSYTIGLENPAYPVPRGSFTVVNKQVDPGVEQGSRWIGLSEAGFGIQGTNNPQYIENISEGKSIVMSNENISELFNLVPVGTSVTVR